MRTVLTLFKYETYKLIHNRLTMIVIVLMMIIAVVMGLPLGQGKQAKDIHNAMRSLDGKTIDNALMEEMNASIDRADPDWNRTTWKWTGLTYLVSLVESSTDHIDTADQFYKMRTEAQDQTMLENKLTEKEMSWWADKNDELKEPFTYVSSYDARSLVDYTYNILLLSMLLAAICLSTIFAGEHRRGMDQIILGTRHGRGETFIAKLMTGFTFILICTAVLMLLLTLTIYASYGLNGLKAIVQMEAPVSAYPLTFIQFFGIQMIILFTAAVLFAAISMALSEILRNGIAVMGLMIGFYLVTQFITIPKSLRLLSESMAMLPTELINIWSLYDHRLVNVFGHYCTMFSVSPGIYVLLSVLLCIVAWQAYRRYQIGGR
jgi:ABC-type transport system involved in multi-copper enzyme maturation permease subunit/ribosomal protein S7